MPKDSTPSRSPSRLAPLVRLSLSVARKSPKANRLKAIVTTLRVLRSGERRTPRMTSRRVSRIRPVWTR